MLENFPRRDIREKPKLASNPNSRYLEYRKREQLDLDRRQHPEKYMQEQTKVEVVPEPSPVITEVLEKKKSWFSKIFG